MRSLFLLVFLATASLAYAETESTTPDLSISPLPVEIAQPDYALGLAEYTQQHFEASIFALERALAIEPAFHAARIAIIRAYLATGEHVSASIQLDLLDGQSLSDEQREQVQQLRLATEQGMGKERRKIQGSVGLAVGSDSNINAGPEITSVTLPQVGVRTLTPSSQSQNDAFAELQATVNYTRFTDAGYILFAGARLENRLYADEGDFDSLAVRGYGGVIFDRGINRYKINLLAQQYRVDGAGTISGDQQQLGAQGQWQHKLDREKSVSVFVQATSIAYADQAERDVTQLVVGAGWEQAFSHAFNPVLSAQLYTAIDSETDSNYAHIGRSFSGIQLALEAKPDERNTGYVTVNYQVSSYDAADPLFQLTRDDKLTHLVLGWSRQLGANWRLQPEARYTRNSSSIVVDDFDRTQLMLLAKYLFK